TLPDRFDDRLPDLREAPFSTRGRQGCLPRDHAERFDVLRQHASQRRMRIAVRVAVGILVSGLALLETAASSAARGDGRTNGMQQPNIVLIQTDDQALTQMSSTVMPNVSRLLAAKGTRFDHAYLTTPECCPSRATLLTGQYGHNNGVLM